MKQIFLLFFLFLFLFLSFNQVQAQAGLVPCGNDTNGNGKIDLSETCTFCDFFKLFKNIIDLVLFRLVPAIAALMLTIGGAKFLFSGGNPSAMTEGKEIMTSVLIGLFLVYVAWLIVSIFLTFIGLSAFGLSLAGPDKWFTIKCP